MKARILFVDDEPNVLQGLQRALRPMRHEWDATFVPGGNEGLQVLATQPFDVVVADLRMPGMDGAALLAEVQARYPGTLRIVLSGQADQQTVLGAARSAHRLLSKPCDAETLKRTLTDVLALRPLLGNHDVAAFISRLDSLPSVPTVYQQLMKELESDDPSLARVGEIVASDAAMVLKLLQIVNSAFFGIATHITDPVRAVSLLGFEAVRALALSMGIFHQFSDPRLQRTVQALWQHSLATGQIAKALAMAERGSLALVSESFTAGLLHDVGKLVMVTAMPEASRQMSAEAAETHAPLYAIERHHLGVTHAEVGAYLLGLWGIPVPVVDAVCWHHEPRRHGSAAFSTLTAVHLANAFVVDPMALEEGRADSAADVEYLTACGLAERREAWRLAAEPFLTSGGPS